MKRPHLNFLVDAASFAAFLLLLSTGLILRYQLPPGSGELEGHGSGRGAANRIITLLWGQTRHDWGEIHYWVAVALMAMLAVHLFLHWKWIVCIVRGTHGDASGWRFSLGAVSLLALIALVSAPVVAPTEQATRHELQNQLQTTQEHVAAPESSNLRGSSTLEEAAAEGGVSVEYLKEKLGLGSDASPDDRIGPLLRNSGKRMSDLRRLLERRVEPGAPSDKETNP
jgi:Domain of unknown function (DUF4405)